MGLDTWASDASEGDVMRQKLRLLVESHESFLLEEQLRAEEMGVDPLRRGPWDARTDIVSLQLGSAAAPAMTGDGASVHSHTSSDRSASDDEASMDSLPSSHGRTSSWFASRSSSFAQLLGPFMAGSGGSADVTDGDVFFRVLVTLSSVTAEMQSLAKDAHRYHLPPLCLFADENNRHLRADADLMSTHNSLGSGQCTLVGGAHRSSSSSNCRIKSSSPEMSPEEAMTGVAQLMQRHMQELWAWQQRTSCVAVYALRQLSALYAAEHVEGKGNAYRSLTETRFPVTWQALADLLGAITTVEEVLQQHASFKLGYVHLRRVVAHVLDTTLAAGDADGHSGDSTRDSGGASNGSGLSLSSELNEGSLRTLQNVVVRVGDDLLRYGRALRLIARAVAVGTEGPPYAGATTTQQTDSQPSRAPAPPSATFCRELLEVTMYLLQSVEDALGTEREGTLHTRVLGTAALYQIGLALLLREQDAFPATGLCHDVGRRLFALHIHLPILHLHGNYSLPFCEWLGRRMPRCAHVFLVGKPAPVRTSSATTVSPARGGANDANMDARARALVTAAAMKAHAACVTRLYQSHTLNYTSVLDRTTTRVSAWLAEMAGLPLPGVSALPISTDANSSIGGSGRGPSAAAARCFTEAAVLLIQRGLLLAQGLQHLIASMLTLSRVHGAPLPMRTVDGLRHAAEMLMMVRESFHAKSGVLAATFAALTRSIAYVVAKHLHAARARLSPNPNTGNNNITTAITGTGSLSLSSQELRVRMQRRALDQALLLLHRPLTPDTLVLLSLLLDVIANRRQLPSAVVTPGSAATTTTVRQDDCSGADGTTMRSSRSTMAAGVITEQIRATVFMAFAQLTRVMEYQLTLQDATSCTELYWQRAALYPRFFQSIYERPTNASRLPYLAAALGAPVTSLILAAKHVSDPQQMLLAPYRSFVMACLRAQLLLPLCTGIEDDLRLNTHGAVLGQPFRTIRVPNTDAEGGNNTSSNGNGNRTTTSATRDLGSFTRLPPFKLFGDWVDLAARVEDHLDTQFYNLNALMPNDWKTYEEMRNLALERYGLTVAVSEGSLPGGIVDQGLDVLVVTEDIQLFIAHYTYNLNEQLFIQRPRSTQAKHLHTLHTRHVANSIRTHGTGIMNSSVNYVYRCVLKKLSTLLRFLSDETVKSRLIKDEGHITAARHESTKRGGGSSSFVYPLPMAEQFNADMRILGTADDGETFLWKFSRLVSEIGNALGYMRMIRSGGLRAIADAAQFLPHSAAEPVPLDAETAVQTATGRTAAAAIAASRISQTTRLSRHLPRESSLLLSSSSNSVSSMAEFSDDSSNSSSGDDEEEGSDGGAITASSILRRKREEARRRQRARIAVTEAVGSVDRVTESIAEKLSDSSDYLRMLLDAIRSALGLATPAQQSHDSCLAHLRLFYLIVPPMCVTFVSTMIREKEQLMRRGTDAMFTDDGFGLGCVFLLSLSGVFDLFQSLRFFDSARDVYVAKLRAVHEAMMAAPDAAPTTATDSVANAAQPARQRYADRDAEEASNLHLAAAMLDTTLREFAGLEETFVSSAIFFHAERESAMKAATAGTSKKGPLDSATGRRRRHRGGRKHLDGSSPSRGSSTSGSTASSRWSSDSGYDSFSSNGDRS